LEVIVTEARGIRPFANRSVGPDTAKSERCTMLG